MAESRSALIIGASRGLGLALTRELLARQWQVTATTRGRGDSGLQGLVAGAGGRLVIEQLDMTDEAAIDALGTRLPEGSLDLLFVNAGIALGPDDQAGRVSTEDFSRIMVTNALSPMRVIEKLGERVSHGGTIAAMSSSLGSVSLNDSGAWEVYRSSKAALNMLMRSYAARKAGDGRTLALVDPGWVRTDMGGEAATLGVEDSIPGIVDQLAAKQGQPGLHYFNYKGDTIPW